jgi:hypothetical protein
MQDGVADRVAPRALDNVSVIDGGVFEGPKYARAKVQIQWLGKLRLDRVFRPRLVAVVGGV